MYQHIDNLKLPIELPVTRALCIGRNYMDHIKELDSAVPDEALLFMKPATAFCHLHQPLVIPTDKGECHNELEVAVLLKKPLCHAKEEDVREAMWGIGLALDLTLRDVQSTLKAKGHPWERAKAFDFSCPVSGFVPLSQFGDIQDIHFQLTVNDNLRQQGHTRNMMRQIYSLIAEMSSIFTLQPGDVILTGTPKGVGPLNKADKIAATLQDKFTVNTSVTT